jgi:hypothetical protein
MKLRRIVFVLVISCLSYKIIALIEAIHSVEKIPSMLWTLKWLCVGVGQILETLRVGQMRLRFSDSVNHLKR